MRKLFAVLVLACIACAPCSGQTSIYNYPVNGSNSQSYSLNSFQGQKLMFVLLPVTQTNSDSAFLQRLDSVALAHSGALKIIAVPSNDDGFVADSLNTLMSWYASSLDSNIILSQPLYTHKASGTQQDSVFQWLTNTNMNTHFDYDVSGTGSMFFVDEQGSLYGVFGPETMFSNKALNKVL